LHATKQQAPIGFMGFFGIKMGKIGIFTPFSTILFKNPLLLWYFCINFAQRNPKAKKLFYDKYY